MKAGMKNSQWLMVASANLSLLTVNYSGHIGNRWAIALGQILSKYSYNLNMQDKYSKYPNKSTVDILAIDGLLRSDKSAQPESHRFIIGMQRSS